MVTERHGLECSKQFSHDSNRGGDCTNVPQQGDGETRRRCARPSMVTAPLGGRAPLRCTWPGPTGSTTGSRNPHWMTHFWQVWEQGPPVSTVQRPEDGYFLGAHERGCWQCSRSLPGWRLQGWYGEENASPCSLLVCFVYTHAGI